MAANPHWGERGSVRPPHATTSLVVSGKTRILVDPSLPTQVLIPRLLERSGLGPDEITHVFLTCLNPIHRRGLLAFERAVALNPNHGLAFNRAAECAFLLRDTAKCRRYAKRAYELGSFDSHHKYLS